MAAATKLDAKQYTVQYELLRSQVIGPAGNAARRNTAGQPRGVGLALLLSEGIPRWLETVEAVLRASLAPRAEDSLEPLPRAGSYPCSAAAVWLSSVQSQEVTTLLASLVLSTRSVAP